MIGPTDLLHPSPAPLFKIFQVFLICCQKRPSFSTIQSHAPNVAFYCFFLKFKSSLLVKRVFFWIVLYTDLLKETKRVRKLSLLLHRASCRFTNYHTSAFVGCVVISEFVNVFRAVRNRRRPTFYTKI